MIQFFSLSSYKVSFSVDIKMQHHTSGLKCFDYIINTISIYSDPLYMWVFLLKSPSLGGIYCNLLQSLILPFSVLSSEQTPETMGMPLDLMTSEVTARSFRVSWSHAPGNVEKYRVVYYPAQGGEPQEVHSVFLAKDTTTFTVLLPSLLRKSWESEQTV